MDTLVILMIVLIVLVLGVLAVMIFTLVQQRGNRDISESIRIFGDVRQTLGQLLVATHQVEQVGAGIANLRDILATPQLRGMLGEQFLEQMLEQMLPQRNFRLKHQFLEGHIVDAAIVFEQGLIPIDSKFPLEDFKRLLQASPGQKRQLRRQFIRACRKHVDDIAIKYIRPEQNGFDFAMMYIPAENIYYELIQRDEDSEGLTEYAFSRRVVIVSPSTFYTYLTVIVLGLKGLYIEENARLIMGKLRRLEDQVDAIDREFGILGEHLKNAQLRWNDARGQMGNLRTNLKSLSTLEVGESEDIEAHV
jgi:DNA recombination protein RmuC